VNSMGDAVKDEMPKIVIAADSFAMVMLISVDLSPLILRL
jgi:hypothetical protein